MDQFKCLLSPRPRDIINVCWRGCTGAVDGLGGMPLWRAERDARFERDEKGCWMGHGTALHMMSVCTAGCTALVLADSVDD